MKAAEKVKVLEALLDSLADKNVESQAAYPELHDEVFPILLESEIYGAFILFCTRFCRAPWHLDQVSAATLMAIETGYRWHKAVVEIEKMNEMTTTRATGRGTGESAIRPIARGLGGAAHAEHRFIDVCRPPKGGRTENDES